MAKCIYYLLAFLIFVGCQSEEDVSVRNSSIGETTDFVRLSDEGTNIAGTLKITANVPEVELAWFTSEVCNLDTSRTTLTLKDGKGEIPILWKNKTGDRYAPEGIAFKAWVKVQGGDFSKYIPLILADRVDSVSLIQEVQTRSLTDPKVSALSFDPPTVVMSKNGGETVMVKLENVASVSLQYDRFAENGIDVNLLPANITQSQALTLNWANQAPTTAFTTVAVGFAVTENIWGYLTVSYDPDGGGDTQTLNYISSSLPMGNIPATATVYTFDFEGGYTGQLRVRSVDATTGTVLFNGPVGTTHSPKVTVPANNATATRNIKFQYRLIDVPGASWMDLPASTNRRQDGNGCVVPGDKPSHTGVTPVGDIPDAGGDYSTTFFNYAGEVFFRAVSGKGRLLAHTSITVAAGGSTKATLLIPEGRSQSDNMVIFQFSTDDANWTDIETRIQIVETFASGSFNDMPMTIPASGGTYHYSTTGTLSAVLTVVAKDENNVVLVESKGKAGTPIPVAIPANDTGRSRSVFFWYMRGDQPGRYNYIKRADQAGI